MLNTNSLEVGVTRSSNANIAGTGQVLNIRAKYTANYGVGNVTTANANLDGTGSLATVLTAASNGTYIKRVIIKGQVSSTTGMVRLFITYNNGEISVTKLFREIEIPAVTKSSKRNSFSLEIPISFYLKAADILKASTENGESFNVIGEGLDITYPA